MEIIREELKLPYSTAECDVGPVLTVSPGRVDLKYDHPQDEEIGWTELEFYDAIAIRVIPDISVTQDKIKAYSKICIVENSDWIMQMSNEAAKHGIVLKQSVQHFLVYFDHYGSVEICAGSVCLNPKLKGLNTKSRVE